MLSLSLIYLLLSNSVSSRRDKSISFSRITITILVISFLICYDNLYFLFLNKGIGIYGGLLHITTTTIIFHIIIISITSIILLLIYFYPRKVWIKQHSSLNKILFTIITYYQTIILNCSPIIKIIECPSIILFIVIGVLFLKSASNILITFVFIIWLVYGLYLLINIYMSYIDCELNIGIYILTRLYLVGYFAVVHSIYKIVSIGNYSNFSFVILLFALVIMIYITINANYIVIDLKNMKGNFFYFLPVTCIMIIVNFFCNKHI